METIFKSPFSGYRYLEADFNWPRGVVVDSEGDIIFADANNNRILKIIKKSKIVVVAGSGEVGDTDGWGLSAKFNTPFGLDIDSKDNVYVCDGNNNAIRKINRDGLVTTIYNGPDNNPCYDVAYYEKTDTVFFCDGLKIHRIQGDGSGYKVWAGSLEQPSKDGQGTDAFFNAVYGITVNQFTGDLYGVEFGGYNIRKINTTAYVSTVYKNLHHPWGVRMMGNDSLIFTEIFGYVVKRYNLATKSMEVIAGNGDSGVFDGAGTSGVFCLPVFLAYNKKSKEIIVSEWGTGLRVIDSFNYLSTLAMPIGMGNVDGPASQARFTSYFSMALDDANKYLYVIDQLNNGLRRVSLADGSVKTIAGKPYPGSTNGKLADALFSSPSGIAYHNETLYIAEMEGGGIRRVNLRKGTIENFISVHRPEHVKMDYQKEHVYMFPAVRGGVLKKYDLHGSVVDVIGQELVGCQNGAKSVATFKEVKDFTFRKNGTIYMVDLLCYPIRMYNPQTETVSEGPYYPHTVQAIEYVESEDALYLGDPDANMITKISLKSGAITTVAGTGASGYRNGNLSDATFTQPAYMAFGSDGSIYVNDRLNYAVRVIRPNGIVETLAGFGSVKYHGDPDGKVDLSNPQSVVMVGDVLYIANTGDSNIVALNYKTRSMSLIAGNGAFGWLDGSGLHAMFNRPEGITHDPVNNLLLVADTKNHLIRQVTLDGLVSTMAGTGDSGSKNGNLLEATFNNPSSIAIDKTGIVYISDTGNHVIRKIANGKVWNLAGVAKASNFVDGRLLAARFSGPKGISIDMRTGELLVADTLNHAIRSINATHVRTMAGNGTRGFLDGPFRNATFSYPVSFAIDGDVLYVSDWGNDRIRMLANGSVTTISGDGQEEDPSGLFVGSYDLFICYGRRNSIKTFRIRNPSLATSQMGSSSNDSVVITVSVAIAVVVLGGCAAFYLIWKRTRLMKKQNVVQKLQLLQASPHSIAGSDSTASKTLNATPAFAVPGYLRFNINKAIKFGDKIDKLGQGGTASVLLAKLKLPELIAKHGFLDVAVKVLSNSTDKNEIESFYYEIALLNALPKSPNLVEFVGYSDKPLAIIMKQYPLTLQDFINDKRQPISFEVRLSLCLGIAKGMALLHEKGIIHFDLKPANVMVAPESSNSNILSAVICDFGFANFSTDAKQNLARGVKVPTNVGITARYAAPELFAKSVVAFKRLDQDADKKIDVFAFAMTSFFLFTGIKPWAEEVLAENIEIRVCKGDRPQIPDEMDKDIGSLILSCWSQDPLERPRFNAIVEILEYHDGFNNSSVNFKAAIFHDPTSDQSATKSKTDQSSTSYNDSTKQSENTRSSYQ